MIVTEVVSSMMKKVAYDEESKQMYITFSNGSVSRYDNVTRSLYDDFISSESVGKYFHKNISKNYQSTKI